MYKETLIIWRSGEKWLDSLQVVQTIISIPDRVCSRSPSYALISLHPQLETLCQSLEAARTDNSHLHQESELVVANVNQWIKEEKWVKLGLFFFLIWFHFLWPQTIKAFIRTLFSTYCHIFYLKLNNRFL